MTHLFVVLKKPIVEWGVNYEASLEPVHHLIPYTEDLLQLTRELLKAGPVTSVRKVDLRDATTVRNWMELIDDLFNIQIKRWSFHFGVERFRDVVALDGGKIPDLISGDSFLGYADTSRQAEDIASLHVDAETRMNDLIADLYSICLDETTGAPMIIDTV